jgi:RHH-type proline utilization regulon transcriptional repressor/proline dehydrogenase/delta 1-pyrroline-5-carboxylate dehydrogenase
MTSALANRRAHLTEAIAVDRSTPYDFIRRALPGPSDASDQLSRLYHADETELVGQLLAEAELGRGAVERVNQATQDLVRRVRKRRDEQGAMEAFMQEYDLSSEEGVVLMCLAEALLRIPDKDTAEALIADKLSAADWESHLGKSSSVFVNASTWGLMLTGKLVRLGSGADKSIGNTLGRMVNRSGEPVIRSAILQAMRIMGFQYVMGRSIEEALERAERKGNRGFRYSFDMLGEAALTAPDAERYFESYCHGIRTIGQHRAGADIFSAPSISVKLSALHPRYQFTQRDRVLRELAPRLRELALLAREHDVALTVDAEEADRLVLSMELFAAVLRDPGLRGWDGFGVAIQTYLKMAGGVIDLLTSLARETGHRLPVRLVKGAYWDAEIKHAQVEGFGGYPVFTRKANTDVSFIACARRVLARRGEFYPQFATHNAHTIAVITELAGQRLDYEFQRLHGMGKDLYAEVMNNPGFNSACRVYAPVDSHEDLLPYLVRRLLENGSNMSFVNRIVDEKLPVEKVAEDPIEKVQSTQPVSHPAIPLPAFLYGAARRNSAGVNLASDHELRLLAGRMQAWADHRWSAGPLLAATRAGGGAREAHPVENPAMPGAGVGTVEFVTDEDVRQALAVAHAGQPDWDRVPATERAAALDRAADLFEKHLPELLALLAREAGKTLHDGVAEVREAADFLRYYALQARELFDRPVLMPGPTGEHNQVTLHGRGVFACISPWNFPLAIFTGQVSAALAAGNAVLAKPAEPTPIVAYRAVQLLHEAGIPRQALQLLPGSGRRIGSILNTDPRLAGVALTGSTQTARLINRALAERDAPLATLIAETGGQNAMLVDSSALPEQVVKDIIVSAFHSAGQRCSALRVLYLQADIADKVLGMLAGAMQELVVGDPRWLSTDVGPVINAAARDELQAHVERMEREGRLIARAPLDTGLEGSFLAPCAFEIDSIGRLEDEVFGPVLHVIRYRSGQLDRVIEDINGTGFGLTLGIHSRIDRVQQYIARRVRVGNCYVNRSMIGAVVGVQPFGGEGLSGTGPKAGGPHYLTRFATERTLTINTAAVGGNTALLAMED